VIAKCLSNRRQTVALISVLFCLFAAPLATAQGLKLGTPETDEGTLDLGAGPKQKPAAQTNTQPAVPTGADVKRTTYKAPLGVVLTEGLALKIDGGQDAVAPFQVCTEQGCLVREPIADELIGRLKKGNAATVTVVAANQGVVTSSISLSGFTAAYNALR